VEMEKADFVFSLEGGVGCGWMRAEHGPGLTDLCETSGVERVQYDLRSFFG
jgi:hypothetical protein